MRPFWCFFGGKWRSAPHYPAPRHDTIVEPFAGAAGYAIRYHSRRVILVEKDPLIAGLWRWLIKASGDAVRALPLDVRTTVADLGLDPAPSALIGFWVNKGAATPRQTPSAWMRGWDRHKRPATYWGAAVRERIAAQVERIRHWHVHEGDFTEAPDIEATWFVDPPYRGGGGGGNYRVKVDDDAYLGLGCWCRERRGQVIVCEKSGADWLPFQRFKTCKANESRHGGKRCTEVLWLSGAPEPRP